ncbi:MAG: site-specific DNA-methyltransferase, partial [Acidimicrobiia bacterium]|nr:site-specific DNA-methyltransferase [Acidimicrobiia bacterium]
QPSASPRPKTRQTPFNLTPEAAPTQTSGLHAVQEPGCNIRVRSLMDEVFGSENFVSQICIKTTSGAGSPSGGTLTLASVHDYVLWYGRDAANVKYRQAYGSKSAGEGGSALYRRVRLSDGLERPGTRTEVEDPSTLPDGARLFRPADLTSQSSPPSSQFTVEVQGHSIRPTKGGWKTNRTGMAKLKAAGRLFVTKNGTLQYVRFLDDFPAYPFNDVWTDVGTGSFTEEKVYIVQTNTKVIQRCMLMCTDPGDLVLDPTCGSGTTAHVAEQWGRRWITIDTSRVALALTRQRLMGAKFPYYLLADSAEGRLKEGQITGTALPDSQPSDHIRHGFVYERVQHITLKSIVNNPDIVEGMSRSEVDAAIKRHADFELLQDKPYESNNKVRVTGPFTVESLSPHRSLAFAGGPDAEEVQGAKPASEQAGEDDASGADFQQTLLDNLLKAGIQNGQRRERIELETLEPFPGELVHAVGVRKSPEDDEAEPTRVGISLGPQYGTVSARWVKDAAREAIAAGDVDLLCILAFAFDPNVIGAEVEGADVNSDVDTDDFASVADQRQMGRVPVLLVRMNADLVMGEELKKTGAGNLFTVFGEPDIEITDDGDELTVQLHGVDVYDPATGEVRSRDTDQIALWMIDSDYDGESFFVRHAYFTGGQDPYKKLKRALKAEIDEDAWAGLYRTTSRPFPKPSTGRIAVKVINDYGDEVLQVFDTWSA